MWPKRGTEPTPKESYDIMLRQLRWLGGAHYQVATRIHGTPLVFDEIVELPKMYGRLIRTIDAIFEQAEGKRHADVPKNEGES